MTQFNSARYNPDIALQYLNLKLLVSGLITGLLLGKAIFYYKKASPN